MLCILLNAIPFICFTHDNRKKDPPLDSLGGLIEEDNKCFLKSFNCIEDVIKKPLTLLRNAHEIR